jgi:hypothetical protein
MDKEKAVQDLEYIRTMMEETRQATIKTNPLFSLWGIATLVLTIATYIVVYIALSTENDSLTSYISWLWWIPMTLLMLYSISYFLRIRREFTGVQTLAMRVNQHVWMSVMVGIGIVHFLMPAAEAIYGGEFNFALWYALILVLLASGLYVTGEVYSLRVLKRVAFLFWLGTAAVILIHPYMTPLVYGVVVGSGLLISGRNLRKHASLENG